MQDRDADGMRYLAGASFAMGSRLFYPEEAPVRQVRIDPFRIDVAPVTNRDFAAFVAETGHVTLAEVAPDWRHPVDGRTAAVLARNASVGGDATPVA